MKMQPQPLFLSFVSAEKSKIYSNSIDLKIIKRSTKYFLYNMGLNMLPNLDRIYKILLS